MILPILSDVSSLFPGAPEWLSTQALLCGAAALGLLVLSFLLKGLQKVVSLAVGVALILGVGWFFRDAWENKEKFLSPALASQLDSLADRTLRSPQAQNAWASIQEHFVKLVTPKDANTAPEKLDAQRKKIIAEELNRRSTALRQEGHRAAADELNRLRDRLRE